MTELFKNPHNISKEAIRTNTWHLPRSRQFVLSQIRVIKNDIKDSAYSSCYSKHAKSLTSSVWSDKDTTYKTTRSSAWKKKKNFYYFPQMIFTLLFQRGNNVSNDLTDCVMAWTSHSLKSSQKPGWGVLSAIHRARNSHQMYGNLFLFCFVFVSNERTSDSGERNT